MKLPVERDQLAEAVAWTARALPARPTAPVLAGMRLLRELGGVHKRLHQHEPGREQGGFRRRYRDVDVLLVGNIQFLGDRDHTTVT